MAGLLTGLYGSVQTGGTRTSKQITKLYGPSPLSLTVNSYSIPVTNKMFKYISVTDIERSPTRSGDLLNKFKGFIDRAVSGYRFQFTYVSSTRASDNLCKLTVLFKDGTQKVAFENQKLNTNASSQMIALGVDGDGSISQSFNRYLLAHSNPNFEMWPEEDRDEYIYVDTDLDPRVSIIVQKLYASVNGQTKLVYPASLDSDHGGGGGI